MYTYLKMKGRRLIFVYILITSIFYISRFVVFAQTQNVGIEHDSGWYLGVARNLAEKGIYASYTNTIADSNNPGPHPSIHGRFSVQDRSGFSYFPAGVTVGPGFIVPQAVVYFLFGFGEWQNRIISLAALAALIPLLMYIAFRLGGLFSLVLFQLWIWFYPQLFLNWAFEAFSEHLALLYLLGGYVLLVSSKRLFVFLLSGLLISLAILTKNIYFIGIFPVLIYFVKSLIASEKRHLLVKGVMIFLLGFCIPIVLFELYRFFTLYALFGLNGYMAINKDLYLTMKCCGSGVVQFIENPFPVRFMLTKILIWNSVGIYGGIVLFASLLLVMAITQNKKNALYFLVGTFFILYFGWFIVLSSTGFFRHAWPSIILGFILLTSLVRKMKHTLQILVFLLFMSAAILSPYSIRNMFFTNSQVESIHAKMSKNAGPLFIHFFNRKDQEEVASYFKNNPLHRRICYDETLLVAEMPVYLDRVFFPIQRCVPGDTLIIGPYQKQYLIRSDEYLPTLMKDRCGKLLFENASYTLCRLK